MCVGDQVGGGGGSTYIRTGSPRGGSRRGRSPRCPSPPPPVASRHSLVMGWWRAAAGRSRRKHLGLCVCAPPPGGWRWRRRGGREKRWRRREGEGDGVADVRDGRRMGRGRGRRLQLSDGFGLLVGGWGEGGFSFLWGTVSGDATRGGLGVWGPSPRGRGMPGCVTQSQCSRVHVCLVTLVYSSILHFF